MASEAILPLNDPLDLVLISLDAGVEMQGSIEFLQVFERVLSKDQFPVALLLLSSASAVMVPNEKLFVTPVPSSYSRDDGAEIPL